VNLPKYRNFSENELRTIQLKDLKNLKEFFTKTFPKIKLNTFFAENREDNRVLFSEF
jgi:hypothetical protein